METENKSNERKRYRREEEKSSESDSDYVPYVSVKDRKRQQLAKLGRVNQIKQDEDRQNKGKSSSENELDNEEDDGQVNESLNLCECRCDFCCLMCNWMIIIFFFLGLGQEMEHFPTGSAQ